MYWLACISLGLLAVVLALGGWRQSDRRADAAARRVLVLAAGPATESFHAEILQGLPEPAQRYFRYTIRPGTVLHRVVELDMEGELGMGNRESPGYRPITARQILAPPHGLVWALRSGAIGGSDGALPDRSWTRFWLSGFIPVARAGGNEDHRRSAFGRVVAEAAFWAPASLLPGPHVRWEGIGSDSARATVSYAGLEQAVDITVTDAGQPTRVLIQRWSDANAEKTYRLQPFGGKLSGYEDFGGYRLPTVVEGGNFFGTDEYFPFFKVRVTAVGFPSPADER